MSSPTQKEIELLTAAYAEKLPTKFQEIEDLWKAYKDKKEPPTLETLHLKAHSLKGSSGIYGFMEINKTAKNLEAAVVSLQKQPNDNEASKQVETFITELKSKPISIQNSQVISVAIEQKSSTHKGIYFFDNDPEVEKEIISQLSSFAYETQVFNDINAVLEALKKEKPIALILNIDLLMQQNPKLDIENFVAQFKRVPLIFISDAGTFKNRLRAAQLQGQAFLVKPFTLDDVLSELDRIVSLKVENFRVLIIDDDLESAKYFSTLLTAAGMSTKIIHKAEEIDSALHEFNADIVLVDYYMPGCNGMELASILRQQRAYENIPIIFLSSEDDKLIQLKAMSVGADDFIMKSIEPEHLILTVHNKIARYKTLKMLAMKDNLTGVFSHTFVLQQLNVELKYAARIHIPLSIALINVDNLAKINAKYGDSSGDKVLKSLSLFISNRFQGSFVIGRYAGDEFLIILPDTTYDIALSRIQSLRDEFAKIQFASEEANFNASFSIGISDYPRYKNVTELLDAANAKLKEAKEKVHAETV